MNTMDDMDNVLEVLIKVFFKASNIALTNTIDSTLHNQLKDNINKLENHVETIDNLSMLISDEELDNETNDIKINILLLFILSLRLIKQLAEEETKTYVMICNLCISKIINAPE